MTTTEVRSTFVDVLAWIFIILSGMGTLILVMETIMFETLFNSAQMQQAFAKAADSPHGLDQALFMGVFHTVLVVILVWSVVMLASSIGLLRRKNWARVFFIVILVIGVIWNLLGAIGQTVFAFFMYAHLSGAPPEASQMTPALTAMFVIGTLFGIGFCVLFIWLIKRLRAPAIVAEFKPSIAHGQTL